MSDIGIQDLFADNGPIEELELDEDLERHLVERQHGVSFSEILGVFNNSPQYYENLSGRRTPVIMVSPTFGGRMLCVPIEPTGKAGVWRPVTAYPANAHHVERYNTEEPHDH